MSFIGDEHKPAPKLKEARLSQADLCLAYEQVVEVREEPWVFFFIYFA